MRPLRFLLSLILGLLAFILLISTHSRGQPQPPPTAVVTDDHRRPLGAYFSWHTPSSLFPPSAIISLTDDNSTFFLARPAAFGPLLSSNGLSAQLWVGSGFNADHLGSGGEGELGCSDIPDWDHGKYWNSKKSSAESKNNAVPAGEKPKKRSAPARTEINISDHADIPSQDDGTDDHLHHPLPPSGHPNSKGKSPGQKKPTHADIQSLQESAEIAGKVVLLSRGGCGFLEKVKWVQRRGGTALIVGDDLRGGVLVTMYAHGDTSNVTIPSVFTSHTTAHLLSSLIPSGGALKGLSPEYAARLGVALDGPVTTDLESHGDGSSAEDKPNFTVTAAITKSTSTPKAQKIKSKSKSADTMTTMSGASVDDVQKSGWLRYLFGPGESQATGSTSRRFSNGGTAGWVLQEVFNDGESPAKGNSRKHATTTSTTTPVVPVKTPNSEAFDGFIIGVQDWRDADLVAEQKERLFGTSTSSTSSSTQTKGRGEPTDSPLKGGSITPGSGEYVKAVHEVASLVGKHKSSSRKSSSLKSSPSPPSSGSWLSRLFSSQENEASSGVSEAPEGARTKHASTATSQGMQGSDGLQQSPHHDGLWVTITPTSMSTSPFFDTLLVLVVSPLVTLTVVYALLVLRSRIRRRRWRAPKAVIERLPIRTYQTMPSGPPSSTSSSISTSVVDASTPLLPSSARAAASHPRPRSRTASEVPIQSPNRPLPSERTASPALDHVEERRAAGLAEWRRRYGGKQRECVVCLDEYVDGVSRVMSLPCGHEFHAECITPWLTTRRRTCPICKGDVVRSLARSSTSASSAMPGGTSLLNDRIDEEDEDEFQERVASTHNEDPWANAPVSREDDAFEDLERGLPDRTR